MVLEQEKPGGQLVHATALAALYVPLLQAITESVVTGQKLPAGQF